MRLRSDAFGSLRRGSVSNYLRGSGVVRISFTSPETLDGGNAYGTDDFFDTLDGGNQAAVATKTYDGLDSRLSYFTPNRIAGFNRLFSLSNAFTAANTLASTFGRALATTLSATVQQTRNITKTILGTVTHLVELVAESNTAQVFNQAIDASMAATVAFKKQMSQLIASTLAAGVNATRALTASIGLTATATLSAALTTASVFYRALTATVTNALSLALISARFVSLTLLASAGAQVVRLPSKVLGTGLTATAALQRGASKVLALTSTQVINLFTQSSRFVSLSVLPEVGVALVKVTSKFLSATAEFLVNLARSVSKSLAVTATLTSAVANAIAVQLSLTLTAAVNIARNTSHAIASGASLAAEVTRVGQFSRALNSTLTAGADVVLLTARWVSLAALSLFEVAVQRAPSKILEVTASVVASISRTTVKTLAAATTIVASLFTQASRFVSLSVLPSLAAVANILVGKFVSATGEFAPSVVRSITKALSAALTATTQSIRAVGKAMSSGMVAGTNMVRSITHDLPATTALTVSVAAFRAFSRALAASLSATASLVTLSARWVSLTIIGGYAANLTRIPKKVLEVSLSAATALQKTIGKTLSNALTATALLFTQSSRFVSLSVLPSLGAAFGNFVVAKFLSTSSEVTASIQRGVNTTLSATMTTVAAFQRAIATTLASSLTGTAALVRATAKTLAVSANLSSLIATSAQFYRALAASMSAGAALVLLSARWVSLAVLSSTEAALVRLPKKALEVSSTGVVAFQRSIAKALDVLTTQVVNLFTQSSRFVSLSVLPSFAAAISRTTSKFLNALTEGVPTISRNITHSLIAGLSAVSSISRNISATLSATLSATVVVIRSMARSLSVEASLSASLSALGSFYRTLSASTSAMSSLVVLSARWISFAVVSGFEAAVIRLPVKVLAASASLSAFIRRSISTTLSVITTMVPTLFTQSARFVSLSVLPSLAAAFGNFVIGKSVNATTEAALAIRRSITSALDATLTTTTAFGKTVVTTLAATLQSTLTIVRAMTKTIAVEPALSPAIDTLAQFYRALSVGVNAASALVTFTARQVSFAVLAAFDAGIVRLPKKFIAAGLVATTNISRAISTTLSAALTGVTNLFTQASRFVSLSVLPSIEATVATAVSKLLSVSSSLTAAFQRSITSNISASVVLVGNIVRDSILKNLSVTLTATANMMRNTGKYISATLSSALNIKSGFAFFITLSASLNAITSLSFLAARWVSLAIANLFESQVVRLPNKLLQASIEGAASFQRTVGKSLSLASTAVANLFTQSSRFVSLSVLPSIAAAFGSLSIGKYLEGALDAGTTVLRNTSLRLSATVNAVGAIARTTTSTLAAALSSSVNLTTQSAFFRTLSNLTNLPAIVSTQAAFYRTLDALTSMTGSLLTFSSRYLSLAIVDGFGIGVVRLPRKFLDSVSTLSPERTTNLLKSLSVSQTLSVVLDRIKAISNLLLSVVMGTTATFSKTVGKQVSALTTLVAEFASTSARFITIGALPAFVAERAATTVAKFISATSTMAAAIVRNTALRLEQTASLLASLFTTSYRNVSLSVLASFSAQILRTITNTIAAAANNAVVVAQQSAFYRALAATAESVVSLITLSARWVTMAILEGMATVLVRLPNKFIEATTSVDGAFQRTVGKGLSVATTQVALLFTQSARFVALSVLPSIEVALNRVVGKLIGAGAVLTASIQRSITQTLTALTTLSASIARSITSTLSVLLDNAVNLARTVVFFRSVAVEGVLSVSASTFSAFYRSLTSTLTTTSNMVLLSARWVSLSVVNLFEGQLYRLPVKVLEASTTGLLAIQRNVSATLAILTTQVVSLFTQSSRFVTLSVLPSIQTAFTLTVGKFIDASLAFTITLQRSIATSLGVLASLGVTLSRRITSTLAAALTAVAEIFRPVVFFTALAANAVLDATLTTFSSFYRTLTTAVTGVSSIVVFTARWVSLSVLNAFDGALTRLPNKVLQVGLTATATISRNTSKFFTVVSTQVTSMFTTSSRFVALSVLPSIETAFALTVDKFLEAAVGFAVSIQRRVTSSLNVALTASVMMLRNITSVLNSSLTTTLSITRNITNSLSTSLSALASLTTQSAFFRTLSATITSVVSLVTISSRYLSLAVLDSFAAVLIRVPAKVLDVTTEAVSAFQRRTAKALASVSTQVASLFTQSSRFLTLSVLPALETTLVRVVGKFISAGAELGASFQRNVTQTLAAIGSLAVSISRRITQSLSLLMSLTVALSRPSAFLRNLAANTTFDSTLSTLSAFYRTLSATTTAITNAVVFTARWVSLATLNAFDAALFRLPSKLLAASFEAVNAFALTVGKFISTTSTLVPTLFTTASRFVTLSVLPSIQAAFVLTVGKFIDVTATFTTAIQRRISNALAVLGTLTTTISRSITNSIAATIDAVPAISRNITQRLTAVVEYASDLVRQASFFRSIEASLSAAVSLVTLSFRSVSLAILNTMDATLVRVPNKLLEVTAEVLASMQRRITNTLAIASTQVVSLFTQSARFLTLSVLPSIQAAFNNLNIGKFLNSTTALGTFIQRTSTRTLQVAAALSLAIARNITQTVTVNLVALAEVLTLSARSVALAIVSLFDTTLVKQSYRLLEATVGLVINLQKRVGLFLSVTMTAAASFISGVFASVALSVLPLFSTNIQRGISKFMETVYANFEAVRRNTMYRSLTIPDRIDGGSAVGEGGILDGGDENTSGGTFYDALNEQLEFFIAATQTQSLFRRTLEAVTTTVNTLVVFTARWVSLAVLQEFASTIVKLPNKLLEVGLVGLTNIRRAMQEALEVVSVQVVSLFTLASRFLTLSVLPSLSAAFGNLSIGKLVSASLDALVALRKTFANKALDVVMSTVAAISKPITKLIEAALMGAAGIQRIITSTLTVAVNLAAGLLTTSQRYITLAVLNLYEAALVRLPNKLLSATLVAQGFIQRRVSLFLATFEGFVATFGNFGISKQIALVANMGTAFSRHITNTLALSLVLTANIGRGIAAALTFAVASLFEANLVKRIGALIGATLQSVLSSFDASLSLQRLKNLRVEMALRLRQRFIFGKRGTKFAVNKSKPGSQGSAKPTSNDTLGSTRPRNTDNLGGSRLTRGDTEPLE